MGLRQDFQNMQNTVRKRRALGPSPGLGQDKIVLVSTRGKLRLRNALYLREQCRARRDHVGWPQRWPNDGQVGPAAARGSGQGLLRLAPLWDQAAPEVPLALGSDAMLKQDGIAIGS